MGHFSLKEKHIKISLATSAHLLPQYTSGHMQSAVIYYLLLLSYKMESREDQQTTRE